MLQSLRQGGYRDGLGAVADNDGVTMATLVLERLSVRRIQSAKPEGKVTRGPNKGQPRTSTMLCDGGGLNLQVTIGDDGNIRRSWIFRYQRPGHGKRDMGLGSLDTIGLAKAREAARECRELLLAGKDPIDERDAKVARNLAARTAVMTFDRAAAQYIADHRAAWSSLKHAAQWSATLKQHVSPVIGKMSVADIDTPHILKVLQPIWKTRTATAKRIQGRLELIIGAATVAGLRKDDNGHDKPNPARWSGHLQTRLAAPGKVRPAQPQKALPFSEMPSFVSRLRQRQGISPLALEFLILTGVRTADILNAKRAHIKRAERRWDIPQFSKTHKPHRVPLSRAALAVIDKVEEITGGIGGAVGASEYLFPNDVDGNALSVNALLAVIYRMGFRSRMSAHGCRASFRTWAQESTNYPWELCELSLGHAIGDKVERAYARGDGLKKRIAIMESWSMFLAGQTEESGAKVIDYARANA